MDTSDPEIVFDVAGVCNHCHQFDATALTTWFPDERGAQMLKAQLEQIKARGRGQRYDCILGLSGGVDSSFLALKAKEWGLRPLVVHVDAGWNSELAVSNIEKVVTSLGFDLQTIVMDWEEIRDLQLAFLRSGIPNQDTPQDHAFFASVHKYAIKHKLRTVLSGGNFATESVLPTAWQGSAMDAKSLRAIHRRFGQRPLKRYETVSFLQYYVWFPLVKKLHAFRPLNLLPYDKAAAIAELSSKTGWRPYERKHGESLFTKIFQNDFLPRRFGYDKRRAHLSSLVLSGQMSRDEAIAELKLPLYSEAERERDIAYLCKKLRITPAEYEAFVRAPLKTHRDYPNWEKAQRLAGRLRGAVERLLGRKLMGYSRAS